MRKILFAATMAAGLGLVGTSAMAAPAAPIQNGLNSANLLQDVQYHPARRHTVGRPICHRVWHCSPGRGGEKICGWKCSYGRR
jgi:hypothetical protein